MNLDFINVAKKPGVKNCVRINGESDIPEYLKGVIKADESGLTLDCLEGTEKVPLGSVIAFEKLEDGKMNVWNKANWKETTREVNGVFYEIPKVSKAVPLSDEMPQELIDAFNGKFTILEDRTYSLDAGWGMMKCEPNNGYLIIYGKKEDGSLDANFLTKGTPSFGQYYVVDETGQIIESLQEYDLEQNKHKTM